jgi:hypothetical protein
MLQNQDFSKFYGHGGSGEGGGGGGGNEKVRYDLKQIKKWDNEIKVKLNNQKESGKNNKKSGLRETFSSERKEKFSDDLEYRDRAKERRETEGRDQDQDEQMVMISKLSAEETQFLGGDMEHTHLVKGLDYALLNKVRNEVEVQEIVLNSDSQEPVRESVKGISPSTHLGSQIRKFLASKSTTPPLIQPLKFQSILMSARSISTIARSAYEFNIDPLSVNDIPTTVMRSKGDLRFHNGYEADQLCVPYVVPHSLLLKLHEVFHFGDTGVSERKAKRESAQKSHLPLPVIPTCPPSKSIEPINIFDDEVGKYDPSVVPAPHHSSSRLQISSKSYFSSSSVFSPTPTFSAAPQETGSEPPPEPEDLLAPVKKLVAGQLMKQSILTNQSNEIVIEKGKTHRDILGGLDRSDEFEKRKKRGGHSMTEDSGFGMEYLEESEESDGEEGGKKKKKKTSSNVGGPGAGAHSRTATQARPPSGLNRAARRALARGEG